MANATSRIDLRTPFATFLAVSEGDGTIADVLQTLKVDRTGYEVNASGISVAAGQRWSNLVDDFCIAFYQLNPGRKDYQTTTSGAVNSDVSMFTADTNGDVWRIKAIVTAYTATAGEIAVVHLEGHFYRASGTVTLFDPTHTVRNVAALAGVDADWRINSDDVEIRCTGVAAKDITYDIRVEYMEQLQ